MIFIFEKIKSYIELFKNDRAALKRLIMIAGSIAGVALFLCVGITIVLFASSRNQVAPPSVVRGNVFDEPDNDVIAVDVPRPENPGGDMLRPPERTNFLLVGVDNNSLADAIVVGTFYRETGDIHMMSVPRDMVVRLPSHRLAQMRENGIRPPGTLKVNELRGYGGRVDGVFYLQDQLSEMFGVEFDFFVEVQIPAFRRIVDAIGGVTMEIPRPLRYSDPLQNLNINIPAGPAVELNGAMAEGVVRYRQYTHGDLDRNAVQMEFMRQLIRQAATREALLNNPTEIIRIVLEEVRSNIGLEAAKYIQYIPLINGDSVTTFRMPGHVGYVGDREYFIPNISQLSDVIKDVFYMDSEDVNPEEEPEEESAND
ncbi:MAG: LCP family protein [Clostridiales bacterium]|jgi:LCP family protein required for cell wall assembly|nr:LCP family protein [Clostridiales bacterium]